MFKNARNGKRIDIVTINTECECNKGKCYGYYDGNDKDTYTIYFTNNTDMIPVDATIFDTTAWGRDAYAKDGVACYLSQVKYVKYRRRTAEHFDRDEWAYKATYKVI